MLSIWDRLLHYLVPDITTAISNSYHHLLHPFWLLSALVFASRSKRNREMGWDLNPFCVKWFLLTWSTRNSLVISLREDPIPCTVAPCWDTRLMDLGRSIVELTREMWRMKGGAGGRCMQTTMSLNCKLQSKLVTLLDAIIVPYFKIYSDRWKRGALIQVDHIHMHDEFHTSYGTQCFKTVSTRACH